MKNRYTVRKIIVTALTAGVITACASLTGCTKPEEIIATEEEIRMANETAVRNEMLLLSHLHLIFGLESYSYFLYADTSNASEGSFTGMLRWDNTLSDIYYRVKANNERLAAMGYRFLSYSLKGFLTDNFHCLGYTERIDPSLLLSGDNILKSVDTRFDTLVGVFEGRSAEDNAARGYAEDAAGKGYYVLNFNFDNDSTVTLHFVRSTPYTVWGPNGIEAMGTGTSVSFTIDPCDARFVELKNF